MLDKESRIPEWIKVAAKEVEPFTDAKKAAKWYRDNAGNDLISIKEGAKYLLEDEEDHTILGWFTDEQMIKEANKYRKMLEEQKGKE